MLITENHGLIETKKIPIGDGNVTEKGVESASLKPIEIKKIPKGDGNGYIGLMKEVFLSIR